MKLTLDERVKHRLVGLAVILSIAAIFAPAMIKKSNQRLDESTTLFVKLPPKPTPPKIAMPEEQTMFKKVKVAKVEVPKIPSASTELTLTRAEPLKPLNVGEKLSPVAIQEKKISLPAAQENVINTGESNNAVNRATPQRDLPSPAGTVQESLFLNPPQKKVVSKILGVKKKPLPSHIISKKNVEKVFSTLKKEAYLVQLASFSKKQNADILVSKLRSNGYRASYSKVNTPNGLVYKVLVGQTAKKQQAQVLKKRLAAATNLNGMIVTETLG